MRTLVYILQMLIILSSPSCTLYIHSDFFGCRPIYIAGADPAFLVRGGGYNLTIEIFHCEGVEGPAPGTFFDFQRLSHAI